MSWVRPVLNLWLRVAERPFLARLKDPVKARKRFERVARYVFRGPRGAVYTWSKTGSLPLLEVRGPGAADDGLVLYFHGGGYFFGSPRTHKKMLARLSQIAGCTALLPDYRKAPEAPYPAAVQDALAAYRFALGRAPATRIVLGGDSAGGGLAFALLHEILALGLPPPAMTFALSPWVNLADTFPEHRPTVSSEVVLPPERLFEVARDYAGDTPLTNPHISPIYGQFQGSGEVLILVSDSEILFDDSRRMAGVLKDQGVPVSMLIEKDLPHVWPIFHWCLPEAERSLRQIGAAIRAALSLPGPSADS